ncbi:MAG: sigma-70 family RNA polymerase sigma factor [Prevotella sp.]|nr:sigma-70 family RNA polymerase sigma factor [Prevotella sp.]MDY4037907.1 sigma-70 family RNA polymerase sigma factor [Prevotella sp.]
MEDRDIVRRILHDRDTQLYGEIVRSHSGMVFSKAYGIVRNKDVATEITQQTFVRAYTRLADWNGSGSIGPWLAVIAAHLSLNHLEKLRRRREVPLERDYAQDDYSETREQRLRQMETAIAELPETDREIIRLHYYKQRKTSEIATDLNLTASNVLVRLHRIREKLRQRLNHEDNE